MLQVLPERPASRTLDLLQRAVEALEAEDVCSVSASELRDQLVETRTLVNRVEREFCRRVRRVDEEGMAALDGEPSTLLWLRNKCRMSIGEAQQRLDIARHLTQLEGADELLQSGEIGFRHAAVLARATADCGAPQLALHGAGLLPAATRVDPDALSQMARQVRNAVDAAGSLEDARRAHAARRLTLTRRDNLFFLDAVLELEVGAKLRTAIDVLSKPQPDDDRSATQRRADALEALIDQGLRAGDLPQSGGARPHLVVTFPAGTLQNAAGAPGGVVDGGGVLCAESVRRLACDAAIVGMRVSADGEPMSVGREQRTWPASIRRAAMARFGGCAVTGDDCPPAWTQGHHGKHWAHGGETSVSNFYPLCSRHHWDVHEGGKVLVRLGDGRIVVVPPDAIPRDAVRLDGEDAAPP